MENNNKSDMEAVRDGDTVMRYLMGGACIDNEEVVEDDE